MNQAHHVNQHTDPKLFNKYNQFNVTVSLIGLTHLVDSVHLSDLILLIVKSHLIDYKGIIALLGQICFNTDLIDVMDF